MAAIPVNPDLPPRNPFISDEDAKRLVIDREIFGIAVAEVTYEQHVSGVLVPVRAERVLPGEWRWAPPKPPKSTPKQYRLKRRSAGSKRRNKGTR